MIIAGMAEACTNANVWWNVVSLPIFTTKIQEFYLMQTRWASLLNPLLKAALSSGSSPASSTSSLNSVLSNSTGTFSDSAQPSPVQFPNLSVSIKTTGNPVQIFLQDSTTTTSVQWITDSSSVLFKRDATFLNNMSIASNAPTDSISIPASSFSYVDFGATAGTHTYAAYYIVNGSLNVNDGVKILVYEL